MYRIIEIGRPTTTTTSATTQGFSLTILVIFWTKVSWNRAKSKFQAIQKALGSMARGLRDYLLDQVLLPTLQQVPHINRHRNHAVDEVCEVPAGLVVHVHHHSLPKSVLHEIKCPIRQTTETFNLPLDCPGAFA
jgi:hypothetical protein